MDKEKKERKKDELLIEAFATELRVRRAERHISQEELAGDAKINRTYLAKLELGKNQPTLTILKNLALALNCELPKLMEAVLRRYESLPKIKQNPDDLP